MLTVRLTQKVVGLRAMNQWSKLVSLHEVNVIPKKIDFVDKLGLFPGENIGL
jgi:hypothetical protein